MLIGEFKQKVNDKSRIALPKKFREELGSSLIVTKGYEGCLMIMSPAQWEEMVSDVVSGPFVSGVVRDTRRFLMGSASEIELDDQGRFVVPAYLKEYASFKSEVICLGLGNWIEVWDEGRWDQKRKEVEDQSSQLGDKLANLQI